VYSLKSLLSPGSSERRHGAEVGHRGGHQRDCSYLGAAVVSSGDCCVADDRQVQPGTGREPWPSGSAAEEAGNQSEVSQTHKPCGPWIGEAHERSDKGWRRGKNDTDGRREHTDPDRCSLCIVGRHTPTLRALPRWSLGGLSQTTTLPSQGLGKSPEPPR
jgi:hypothetical protein